MLNNDCLFYPHFSTLGDTTLYDQLKEHILTKALLRENNYPHKHPDKPGFAIQYGDTKKGSTDGGSSKRIFLIFQTFENFNMYVKSI